jgi:hypothetical protein
VRDPWEPRWVGALLTATLVAGLGLFARANLPYAGLWYDEAMQFWISRGADAFARPYTAGGGVGQVVRENARGNLDPGGFTLLLHAWMWPATDVAWLRALPFGIFLGGLGAMARLAWAWRPSVAFAVLGAAVPLAYPLIVFHATEVRAYTMEFTGVVVGCLLLHRLQAGAGPARLALTGLALALFMTSRYSYSIFAGATCLAAIPVLRGWSPGDPAGRLRRFLALGLPVLGGVAFAALGLWLQRGRLTGRGGAYVEYLAPATAAGKPAGDLVGAVLANLLSPAALPVTLAAVVALLPARWWTRGPAGRLGLGASPESRALYRLAPAVLALTAALWRWHPWNVSWKWSLYLHALSAVLLLRLLADVLAAMLPPPGAAACVAPRRRAAWTAVAALAVAGLSVLAATQRRVHAFDVTGALRQLEGMPLAAGSVAVGVHPYPVLRYLCEDGPLVGRLPYPAAFRLPHRGRHPRLIGPETRYLIAYESREALARAHPRMAFRADPAWPAHLYAVAPAGGGPGPGSRRRRRGPAPSP